MELRDKKILIVGFERTGEALCRFLPARGAHVLVTEKKPEADLAARIKPWKERGVSFETGGHKLASFLDADLIIPSPGVPPLPEITAAREKGIPVVSEIEL
ncbi:MAG: UDP-N-acetylmuramoyl-L-alanine--D-glutamate ligase, partial [Candidatus Aminicenantales bacterium]